MSSKQRFRSACIVINDIIQTTKLQTTISVLGQGHNLNLGLHINPGSMCNSYTTACPHVRGDNPRALASGLSYVHVDKHSRGFFFIPPTSV